MKEIDKGQQVETGRCSKLREWTVHYEVVTWVAVVNLDLEPSTMLISLLPSPFDGDERSSSAIARKLQREVLQRGITEIFHGRPALEWLRRTRDFWYVGSRGQWPPSNTYRSGTPPWTKGCHGDKSIRKCHLYFACSVRSHCLPLSPQVAHVST